jgi:predicted ATP-binding protein involved in virulence
VYICGLVLRLNQKHVRIKNLSLKNIGPFLEAELDFMGANEAGKHAPVTIITGENGTGKTVVLDAIRGLLLGQFGGYKGRNIVRKSNDFLIKANLEITERNASYKPLQLEITKQGHENSFFVELHNSIIGLNSLGGPNKGGDYWITNYWTSKTSSEPFKLESLSALKPEEYLQNSLDGIQPNVEVIKLICAFDYLRSSDSPKEKREGQFLFDLLKKIIKISLIEGEFKYVERKTLMPIISQLGGEVSLDKLSSGNLYLIQRLVSLLGQMYAVYTLNNLALEELCLTRGLLLIDEAENHLHPKWQKTFLNSILEIFPNLQIIVTTHSPFIVSSVPNARIYVCKSMTDHSIIVDETDEYSNKPIEEILLSPVFNTTDTFNSEITTLIEQRKAALKVHNHSEVTRIEKELKMRNPEYFSYFDVESLLANITK